MGGSMSYKHPFGMTCEERDDVVRDFSKEVFRLQGRIVAVLEQAAQLERKLTARREHCRRVHGCDLEEHP
jgi:hypothetical protein